MAKILIATLGLGRTLKNESGATRIYDTLEYRLGEERSLLWLVTADSLTAFPLPPRRRIESAAVAAYEALRIPEPLGALAEEALAHDR